MNIIRTLISLLLVAVVVLSALGISWWGDPPEALAGYANGGRVILALLIASGLVGLWRLWSDPDRANGADRELE